MTHGDRNSHPKLIAAFVDNLVSTGHARATRQTAVISKHNNKYGKYYVVEYYADNIEKSCTYAFFEYSSHDEGMTIPERTAPGRKYSWTKFEARDACKKQAKAADRWLLKTNRWYDAPIVHIK